MIRRIALITAVAAILTSTTTHDSHAQKKNKRNKRRQAYLDPAKAGPDFKVQGEYTGKITTNDGTTKFGVQVIALGDGKFDAVGYPGGLPGDGWTGDEKIKASGGTKAGVTTLKGDQGSGRIEDGTLTIMDSNGTIIGTLKKTVRKSPTLGAKPPASAVVLFDGTTAKHFKGGKLTKDGLLQQGMTSHRKFHSFKLHLEFQTSFMPYARGQGRSNSGVYMQGRYETQILDSFGLEGRMNECGGIYSIRHPDLNMCLPPLSWQTYDIDFTAAKYDDAGKKTADARMTVKLNGVEIHNNVALPKTTTAAPVKAGPEPGPIYIQNHGNPLRFRNIWLVEIK